MRGIVGIIAGAVCALAIACAAGQKSTMAPPSATAPSAAGGAALPSTPQAQIRELDRLITQDREKMGLGPAAPSCTGPGCAQEASTMECLPAPSETCTNSCTIKDSICSNATKICDLAKQLPGDGWASDRCNAGKSSCKEAKDRCCGCR